MVFSPDSHRKKAILKNKHCRMCFGNLEVERKVQARKDSREPLSRRPFDLQEAVVLLDVYLDMKKNGTSIAKAAEKASMRLRNLAKRNGYIISDSYRSAGGLVNRLRSLGGLYEEQESKSAPGTSMFAEVVSLYKNSRSRYEEILSTEKSVTSQDGQNSGEQHAAHGKATAKEERRKIGMTKINKIAEQEFFQWLPNAVTPSVLKDIQKSYALINVLFIKSRVLPQTLTSVNSTDEVEYALQCTKKTFVNKRLRNTAEQLLAAYIVYLRDKEKAPIETETSKKALEIQPSWIKYDFSNAQSFERTAPVYCAIAGVPIEGKNWARILVGITEQELARHNAAMGGLYKESLIAAKKGRPYLLKERIEGLHCAQLSNGYWVCVNYNIPRLMEMIRALCIRCGYTEEQIVLYGEAKVPASGRKAKTTLVEKKDESLTAKGYGISIEKSEAYLRSVGLQGATVKELIKAIQPDAAVSSTASSLDGSVNIIAMPGNRYIHVDSFVDLDEAEETLGRILRTHFAQFGGYSNNQLLFGAASQEMSMFLNDNDCENIDAVYAIARFLFEKKAVAGAPYKFSTPHIFEKEPDYPMTLRGLMIHLARSNGGLLYASEAKDYLQKTMLTYGGIGQLLQLGSSNTFLIYDSERYLLSELLGIDDAWCLRMHDRLDDLFRKANVAYVIPRDINTAWLTTLPSLPHGLSWTLLLLQEVLDKYPAIGFKSISPDLNQAHDTLAAAFVPVDSPLQTFPDVVTLFMEEHHNLPMRMSGEDLRLELRDAGMLENGEMIYALPKALNDYRFAWSNENKTVYVRGNK
jgi:hypothetical protein